jgi:diguanylate cyclase (GGDEF)-like protein
MSTGTDATWLCEGPLERSRMLELNRAVIGGTALMYLIGLVALLAGGPAFGWWIVGVLLVGAAGGSIFRVFAARSLRPEYWLFAMFVYTQALTSIGIFFTGGWSSPYLAWLAMVCVGLPSYFSRRGVIVGLAFTFVALGLASTGPAVTGDLWLARVCSAACVVGVVTAVGYVMMRTELRYRGESMLDPLTGLMNRRALPGRFEDVRRQALEVDAPIALLAVDVDHFKDVNDSYGHDRGDAVLRELASVMRGALRTCDEVYRTGGEEFLLVAGGATEQDACTLAEHLRNAVEHARPAGVSITISIGVVSRPADALTSDCVELMRVADTALYTAKRAGRNRIHAAAA